MKDDSHSEPDAEAPGFASLDLIPAVQQALIDVGYEQPSPIQAQSIPQLLAGRDLLGVAQTGTGKTAAFALPLLSRVDLSKSKPQILVLAPTRELAIQVSEAFQRYAKHLKGFRVAPIYGGQAYDGQLRHLKRGVHAIVGTPGRVMDHLRRGSLVLDELQAVVLDEADEMLRMGILDDVEWILQHTPAERQTALFSATMPGPIRKVAETYLNNPSEVRIQASTATVEHTAQQACLVHGPEKLEALTRILETADFDGILIFVRTKTATIELAERMGARGFACDALNGDMSQRLREHAVDRFKKGRLDILIATDVAARGIDVPRISHVINFDIPYDTEAYIHRIGRTGRAGRKGTAITFVTPRERRLLGAIERATRSPIEWLDVPRREQLAEHRIKAFKKQMQDILDGNADLDFFRKLMRDFASEHECSTEDGAAALAYLLQRERPLQPPPDRSRPPMHSHSMRGDRPQRPRPPRAADADLERFRIALGREDGVTPGHIVGAIANEAGIDSHNIGRIQLFGKHSTVDLPRGMPNNILAHLKKVRIFQKPLGIERIRPAGGAPPGPKRFDSSRRPAPGKRPKPGDKPRPKRKPIKGKPGPKPKSKS